MQPSVEPRPNALLVIPAKDLGCHDIELNMDSATVASNKATRNLGVIVDDHLSFSDHIASVSQSCPLFHALIEYKALTLAYEATTGPTLAYPKAMLKPYVLSGHCLSPVPTVSPCPLLTHVVAPVYSVQLLKDPKYLVTP